MLIYQIRNFSFLMRVSISVGSKEDEMVSEEKNLFSYAMIISVSVGGFMSFIFHLCVKASDNSPKKVITTVHSMMHA